MKAKYYIMSSHKVEVMISDGKDGYFFLAYEWKTVNGKMKLLHLLKSDHEIWHGDILRYYRPDDAIALKEIEIGDGPLREIFKYIFSDTK